MHRAVTRSYVALLSKFPAADGGLAFVLSLALSMAGGF